MVRVMRYQYQQGERRLTPAGTAQTDDRGQYRVWGLMPGDYYVNAVMRGGNFGGFGGPDPGAFAGRGGGRGIPGAPGGGGEQDQTNYAPTYYPGVPSVNEAKPITVGLSQEVLDINFGMQLVKIARITGHVANPDGTMVTSGNVNLVPENAGGRGAQIGVNFGGRIEWDGAFAITNVPPGRYVLRARANDSDTPLFATQPISLNGENVPDLSVVLSAGASVTGAVTFLPGQTPLPDPTQVRLSAPSTDQSDFGQQSNARVDKEGRFALNGVSAGSHLIRAAGNMRGWTLKSVTIGGRDVTDTPVPLRSGETLANVVVVFTDRLNEVNGTVTDEGGAAVPDFTVLAFPTDATLWRPQARQIMTARPDQTGQYRIRGLPPGEYYLVTVDPTEQGEWFEPAYLDDHRAGAARVTLGDGDLETHDFKVRR
jgi:carboxypeptidase family protein